MTNVSKTEAMKRLGDEYRKNVQLRDALSALRHENEQLKLQNQCMNDENQRLQNELDDLDDFTEALEKASSMLQAVLLIGQVKHIGLLEVPAGVATLIADYEEEKAKNKKLCGLCRAYITMGSTGEVAAEDMEYAINVIHRDSNILQET